MKQVKKVTSAKYRAKTYKPLSGYATVNKGSKTYYHYSRLINTLQEENSTKFILKLLSIVKSLRYLHRELSKKEKRTFKQLHVNYYPTPKNINEILPIIRKSPIDLFALQWLMDLGYELENESFISLVDFENS